MKNHKAKALELILNERARQIEEEGYTTEQDDRWTGYQLMIAGVCYERDPSGRPDPGAREGGCIIHGRVGAP